MYLYLLISRNIQSINIAKKKLKDLMDKSCKILLNTIIVSEVHYKLYRLLNAEEAYERTLKIILSGHVEYVQLEEDTVLKAIELSRSKNIRINDALIAHMRWIWMQMDW